MTQALYNEAKRLSDRGVSVVIQQVAIENGKKQWKAGMSYKNKKPTLAAIRQYLKANPKSNTLAILLEDRHVNLDFDDLESHQKFMDLGLIKSPALEQTRITITASGKYHYIYKLPDTWFGQYNKKTHITDPDGKAMDVDVLFGANCVEFTYPTTLPNGKQYTKNHVIEPTEMPDKLRIYLEQCLGKSTTSTAPTRSHSTPSNSRLEPDSLTMLEHKLVDELRLFGYREPALVRRTDFGYDFTYDHSLPDPLDGTTIHDHIDGYIVVKESENTAIVGTYSGACRRKNALLCYLEEVENILDDHCTGGASTSHVQYTEKFVQPYQDQARVTVVKSDLGTGKTYQMKQHYHKHSPATALILTPRVIFGQCLLEDLQKTDPEWRIYLEESAKGKKVYDAKKLICQMESIWKLDEQLVYDHIYIDEIESCLNQFSSGTMDRKRRDCVDKFEKLFREAKKVVLSDAHISRRTLDFLADLGISDDQICFEENLYVARDRLAWRLPTKNILLFQLQESIRTGKNVVVFSTSRSFLQKDVQGLLRQMLPEDDYIIYLPDSAAKSALKDAESQWLNKRVIAYNSTITVGVDFNIPDVFDTALVYAQNYGCGPVRDVFQAIHRVRQLKDEEIFYFLGSRPEPGCTKVRTLKGAMEYVDVCTDMRNWDSKVAGALAPTWLRKLHVRNVLEIGLSKNCYEAVFDYYLNKCGYTKKCVEDGKEPEGAEFDFEDETEEIPFDEIPEVGFDEIDELEKKVFAKEVDQMEYHMYCKFLYRRHNFANDQLFSLMLHARGRRLLRNVVWERDKQTSSTLIQDNLDSDFLETMPIDTLLLGKIKELSMHLGLETSYDPVEILEDVLNKDGVLEVIADISKLYKIKAGAKVSTKVSQIIKQWNGNELQYVKSKSGKTIKTRTVGGKRKKVLSVQGNDFR